MTNPNKLYYKTCRENASMTQEHAAEMLHIEPTTLSRYENGHAVPDQQLVDNMVLLYNVPNLAIWHIRRVMPALARWIPDVIELRSDGDAYFILDSSVDMLADYKERLKQLFRAGHNSDADDGLKPVGTGLKKIADGILSIATYIGGK